MIEVKNLSKRYGNHYAVKDLSFTVEPGQIYGFLGPNGAGKSTTMNIITGYIASTQGTVTIDGHDILEEPEKAKKCIGYLPEMPPLYMDMTVLEYLKFVAELKKIPKKEQPSMIHDIMETLGIYDMQNRLIKNLSKGYRQRVGLAQAIMGYPPIIILDEPMVGLDPKQIIEIRDLIRELSHRHTIILSSHILSEISEICDMIMIISKGTLIACDAPERLTEMAYGENRLELTIKGESNAVQNCIESIQGVRSVLITEGKSAEFVEVSVESDRDTDIQEDLFYALADAKCPIYRMEMNVMSLEDVFLELTEQAETEIAQAGQLKSEKRKWGMSSLHLFSSGDEEPEVDENNEIQRAVGDTVYQGNAEEKLLAENEKENKMHESELSTEKEVDTDESNL